MRIFAINRKISVFFYITHKVSSIHHTDMKMRLSHVASATFGVLATYMTCAYLHSKDMQKAQNNYKQSLGTIEQSADVAMEQSFTFYSGVADNWILLRPSKEKAGEQVKPVLDSFVNLQATIAKEKANYLR
ncbi:MAG: hypothetical protein ACI8Y7_000241 [Candidatus Woesearchaeota archaeon]|jgi:hypothetical protein